MLQRGLWACVLPHKFLGHRLITGTEEPPGSFHLVLATCVAFLDLIVQQEVFMGKAQKSGEQDLFYSSMFQIFLWAQQKSVRHTGD